MYYHYYITLAAIVLSVNGFEVSLVQNGPVIIGGTVNFWAKVNGSNSSKYKYTWKDLKTQRSASYVSNQSKYEWNITYVKGKDIIGEYFVELEVCVNTIYWFWPCAKSQTSFTVTDEINGNIELLQNNTVVKYAPFVSNQTEVVHNISIKSTDFAFLEDNNYTAVAFWFLNCSYYGMTPDLVFRYNYTTADEDVTIKAIVVAAKLNETSNLTEAFTDKPGSEGSWKSGNVTSVLTPWPDGSCNDSFIPKDPDKYYGYFHHIVKPRRPINILGVKANTWLENGDLLNVTLTFDGSPPYFHCIKFITGDYNKTGNETCLNSSETPSKINIVHYFGTGDKHTVLFIIKNYVSKQVAAVGVNNYIAKKHAQLSVIIVPISFTALAVILIVFGVAYYIQSKNRYTIEVANFDFSASNDTEYKSFRERLREAVSSAFTRVTEEESEEGPYWSPSRKPARNAVQFENSDSDS